MEGGVECGGQGGEKRAGERNVRKLFHKLACTEVPLIVMFVCENSFFHKKIKQWGNFQSFPLSVKSTNTCILLDSQVYYNIHVAISTHDSLIYPY